MKAYIEPRCISGEWAADVITEQDYWDCGPFSRTFRAYGTDLQSAVSNATEWAIAFGLTVIASAHDL
jgi:hypothetical protein